MLCSAAPEKVSALNLKRLKADNKTCGQSHKSKDRRRRSFDLWYALLMRNYCIEDTVMDHYAYTPITTDPVLLNLDGCKDWGVLHQCIRKTFGFPDYYGENWDAMWDCLTDVFLQPVQRHIVVEGFAAMPQELREYAAPMQDIFSDLQEKYPWVSVIYR